MPGESHTIEDGGETLPINFVEENILKIQRKILMNQLVIGDSIKRTFGLADVNFMSANADDPRISYYNNQVVRVENSIIMKQNIILGSVGSFSVSHNAKILEEFKLCEEHFYIISHNNEILGGLSKLNCKKVRLSDEEWHMARASETLSRCEPLPVNKRMIGEKWNRIIENQSSMLDNVLDIMCTLSGMTPDVENGFEFLNKDNHLSFVDNVITTYRYKIHFHENEISSMLNDVMLAQHGIVNNQRVIIEKEGTILNAFNSCVFSRDLVREMSGRLPFLDNKLYALQLKTWAGVNCLLAQLNQMYLNRIDNPSGSDDVVNYQSEVLANQKSILANLSRFPGTQSAIQENQRLIICIQDEVLNHYIPATNNNEPLGEDNIGFKILRQLGWSGGGLGTSQQGIAEPVRAEGVVGRSGLGYKEIGSGNPRKRHAQETSAKRELEKLRNKLMRFKNSSYNPLQGAVPGSIPFNPACEEEKVNYPEFIHLD